MVRAESQGERTRRAHHRRPAFLCGDGERGRLDERVRFSAGQGRTSVRRGGSAARRVCGAGADMAQLSLRFRRNEKNGYRWWRKRISHCLEMYDALRLDHFRAFYNYFPYPQRTWTPPSTGTGSTAPDKSSSTSYAPTTRTRCSLRRTSGSSTRTAANS